MKIILLFTVFLGFSSCQSEYDFQLEKAKLLKLHIETKMSCCDESEKLNLQKEYNLISETIQFHAKMSGNSSVFLEEVKLSVFKL